MIVGGRENIMKDHRYRYEDWVKFYIPYTTKGLYHPVNVPEPEKIDRESVNKFGRVIKQSELDKRKRTQELRKQQSIAERGGIRLDDLPEDLDLRC